MAQLMKSHNADTAVSFLEQVVAGNISDAYEKCVSPLMRHHNPEFEGDASSLRQGMKENHGKHPDKILAIQRTVSENDLVAVHSHIRMNPQDPGMAVMHLFRFENDRIVEMWSVGQPVPDEMANESGMF